MAKSKIPSPLDRRHLIEKDLDAKQAMKIADAYLEQEMLVDAVAFLEKAEAVDRLGELRDRAIETGDVFLLTTVARALGEDPGPDQWRSLAAAAEQAGKAEYAVTALRLAERDSD